MSIQMLLKVNAVTSSDRILKYINALHLLPCTRLCVLVLRVCLESISKMITYSFFSSRKQ